MKARKLFHATVAILTVLGAPAGSRAADRILSGVNLAGAEFSSGHIPGRYGWDYSFPKDEEIAYYTSKGMSLFRLPLSWERLQPNLSGDFDPSYLSRIQSAVAAIEGAGGEVILDIHNYGKYHGQLIGSSDVPVAGFVDLWTRLAAIFGKDGKVLFGLMNEPQLASAADWAQVEQQAVDAVRKSGAVNRILISGVNWDGAHNFVQVNGAALADIHDEKRRLIFEAHQYFDADSSGRSDVCVAQDQVVPRLSSFADWLAEHHARGLLGEFAVGRNAQCLDDLKTAMAYVNSRPYVWYGWTYWAGGSRWGEYMYTLEPTKTGVDRPQMSVLTGR
ncbi:glycoside hydrolase family 5 protein [Acetobacter sacchari]|uniref:Glycoside hydrolase family 5 protein n=1 Tax=Acetobacter sacchari TaxID=2661687 RepID=A0ABS3M070_9PROT|nr:glycoside hydrolase family 5 protein [Acetobacter sacchari]MBO1361555.1 glycoside hydrolase family 5 protein [Acetobacter sacchari]